jgi:hypothetical protein
MPVILRETARAFGLNNVRGVQLELASTIGGGYSVGLVVIDRFILRV